MNERRKVFYKVLGAMLVLPEFTIAELAEYTGVGESSVRSVLRRRPEYLEKRGQVYSGQRGGQADRYRVNPKQVKRLRAELEDLFDRQPRAEEPPFRSEAATEQTVTDPPGLSVAENALLRLFPRADTLKKKRHLIKKADFNAASARLELDGASPDESLRPLNARLRFVDVLKQLRQAELGELPLEKLVELGPQVEQVSNELTENGENSLVSQLKQIILDHPDRDIIYPPMGKDRKRLWIRPGSNVQSYPQPFWAAASVGMAEAIHALEAAPYPEAAVAAIATGANAHLPAAVATLASPEATEFHKTIEEIKEEIQEISKLPSSHEQANACERLAMRARQRFRVDEHTVHKVAEDIRKKSAIRVHGQVFHVLAGEPAFYDRRVFSIEDGRPVVRLFNLMDRDEELLQQGVRSGRIVKIIKQRASHRTLAAVAG